MKKVLGAMLLVGCLLTSCNSEESGEVATVVTDSTVVVVDSVVVDSSSVVVDSTVAVDSTSK